MLNFNLKRDKKTKEAVVETSIYGKLLLTTPQLNKGTAFTTQERKDFELLGKLPHHIESLDEQVKRSYLQFASYTTRLQQNIYLNNLHNKNQILFYKLVGTHLDEMLPIIYTPIVSAAVQSFSLEFREPRGLYISHLDKNNMDEILNNRSNPEIDLIVVTDGEGVLGIGDQGIGGMDIPVAKLMVYGLCGIDPTRTLPIFLDVGTNNSSLLNDPLYLGCQQPRIVGKEYDDFIHTFVESIKRTFPHVFLHWEDFGRGNARRILDTYEDKLCTFNDDIQGTGAVALAALLAACDLTGQSIEKHRIVVFGAGSAGMGISDQILDALMRKGLSLEEAYSCFWLIDRQGLLIQGDLGLTDEQKLYARNPIDISDWNSTNPSLSETIRQVKPTILIGCSAQPGAFSKDIIETMSLNCAQPIVFPLSNPDEKCEAQPQDIVTWSKGTALIATGTAFGPVTYQNQERQTAQCNNALIFPGIGLGILAVQAKRLTKAMIWSASEALSQLSPSKKDGILPLLPSLGDAQNIAKHVAQAVAKTAIETGMAEKNQEADLEKVIEDLFWEAKYLPFERVI